MIWPSSERAVSSIARKDFVVLHDDCGVGRVARQRNGLAAQIVVNTAHAIAQLCAARQEPLAGVFQIVIDHGLHGIDRCIGVRRLAFARIPMMSVILRTHAPDVRRHTADNVFA